MPRGEVQIVASCKQLNIFVTFMILISLGLHSPADFLVHVIFAPAFHEDGEDEMRRFWL